jgi:hypothetical protein
MSKNETAQALPPAIDLYNLNVGVLQLTGSINDEEYLQTCLFLKLFFRNILNDLRGRKENSKKQHLHVQLSFLKPFIRR